MTNYPSQLIEDAVNEISKLPSIGKKTALRLVLHLLKADTSASLRLAQVLIDLRNKTHYCRSCHNISDHEICSICQSPKRDKSIICVVEDLPDLMAIENTAQYNGLYHVLGGVISPIEGISPSDIHIDSLIARCQNPEVKELILALSATMESDTTAFYITQKLKNLPIKASTIARGIPIGSQIEYADELTLGRSILSRIRYE